MKKEHSIIMLPTDKALIGMHMYFRKLSLPQEHGYEIFHKGGNTQPQHLYILSDEEIKEGNWFQWGNSIQKANSNAKEREYGIKNWKSIISNKDKPVIATNNPILITDGIPSISEQFIRDEYIPAYNKYGKVDKVVIEYEKRYPYMGVYSRDTANFIIKPKLNPGGSIACSLPENLDWLGTIPPEHGENESFPTYLEWWNNLPSKKQVKFHNKSWTPTNDEIKEIWWKKHDARKWWNNLSEEEKDKFRDEYKNNHEIYTTWEDVIISFYLNQKNTKEPSQKKSVEELAVDKFYSSGAKPRNEVDAYVEAFIAGYTAKEEELKK